MKLSQAFQWELEAQLLNAAKAKMSPAQGWHGKIIPSLGWALLAVGAVFLLNWTIRSLAPQSVPVGVTAKPEISFASHVRQGDICTGPLALAHGFGVFLTNQDKTGFITLDEQKTIGELRSFAWSPDGRQLAIVGNTTGQGDIYLTNSASNPLRPLLLESGPGYLMDVAWSHNGKQLILWSAQNNTVVYLVNADGTGLVEHKLDLQIFAIPQFAPDNQSIVFYGADSASAGLFQARLESSQTQLISAQVADESAFAWSADGSQLAYIEMDRKLGEARLVAQENSSGSKVVLGTLSIPKGSGSFLPKSGNLSWSHDGKSLVFDFGRGATDRVIYLALMSGTELIKSN